MVKHLGGHLPFEGDITESVKPGEENCVLVKLNNQDNPVIPPGKSIKDLDFNYYSGLYQQVSLIAKDRLYIPDPVHAGRKAGGGVLVHYEGVRKAGATVHVQMEVRNDHNDSRETQVCLTLSDTRGKQSADRHQYHKVYNGRLFPQRGPAKE